EICWQYDSRFLDDKHLFEPTEKVVVKKNYDPNDYHLGAFFSGSWASMIDSVNMQNEWESKNPRPRKKLRIRDLVQNRRWGFWQFKNLLGGESRPVTGAVFKTVCG